MAQLFEGRNVEEALTNAAAALGAERFQLKYSVVSEKRGFLGGVKRVVIEVVVDPTAAAPAPSAARSAAPSDLASAGEASVEDYFDAEPEAAPVVAPREPRPARDRDSSPRRARSGRGRGDNRRGNDERGSARKTSSYDPGEEDLLEQGEESSSAGTARAWCERVISLAGLSIIVRSEESEKAITLRLHGRDVRRFTENHGELLDAVQVLANKALVGRTVTLPIELDCGTFKSQREDELAVMAKEVADRVRRTGREELLQAMSPIERRIVHLALQEDPDVTTDSRGEGFLKRVAIVRRGGTTGEA